MRRVMTATVVVEIFPILQSSCLRTILWISRYEVCIFIQFLFLPVPDTPLHHSREFHDISPSRCSLPLLMLMSLCSQFTTEDD
ncbi:hypothetical protein EDD15DRAFT_2252946 [Pisolithus albus]|nr:hypothetical protein EDD15DRAFT_2252946 [Pisolithus albus]